MLTVPSRLVWAFTSSSSATMGMASLSSCRRRLSLSASARAYLLVSILSSIQETIILA